MRFEARQISEVKEENNRRFIVQFFCGDDTVQVYQVAERNSGIWGGKFLERSRQKNPDTQQFFVEKVQKSCIFRGFLTRSNRHVQRL